jgi:hypothetical protein
LPQQSATHPLALWDITALWSEAKTSKTRLRFAELSKTLAAIISQNNRKKQKTIVLSAETAVQTAVLR